MDAHQCPLLTQSGHSRRAADAPLLRRYARRQRHRRIGAVFELDGHEDHLVIADIFQIVNCEFALAYPAVPCLVGLVGPFDRRAILSMRASAAARNRGPKVIQHVTMEAKALARGKPDDPYAGALILRQQRGANARIRIPTLALELGSDVSRPRRRLLFIGGPFDAALS